MAAQPVSDATIQLWWAGALALSTVVGIVVAVMLEAILRSTGRMRRAVAQIWTDGSRIAANAAAISLLQRTGCLTGTLLESADAVARAAERIRVGQE